MQQIGPRSVPRYSLQLRAFSLVATLILVLMIISGMQGAIVGTSYGGPASRSDPETADDTTTRAEGPQPRQRNWFDDFIDGKKVSHFDKTRLITGGGDHKVILRNMSDVPDYYSSGILISEVIDGDDSEYFDYWEKVLIHKAEPAGTSVKVTILNGGTGNPIPGYEDLDLTDINISAIRMEGNASLRLRGNFNTSLPSSTPILDKWEIWWKPNTPPVTLSADVSNTVAYRGGSVWVYANATDVEDLESELTPIFEWSTDGASWSDTYFNQGSKEFITDYWRVRFIPPIDAALGDYSIRVTFQDLKEDPSQSYAVTGGLEVKNYPPSAPIVKILPTEPTTTDDLVCSMVTESTDLDLGSGEISYKYAWVRNNKLQKAHTWSTVVSNFTQRGDTWRCVVTAYDGIDHGQDTVVATVILNTPPLVAFPILDFGIEEDVPDTTKLDTDTIFLDADGEQLYFKTVGNVHTHFNFLPDGVINITSDLNWYGRETVTITADDGNASASSTFNITVATVNDPPTLQVEGRKTGLQNKWINLTCTSSDVDDSNFIFSTDVSKFKSNFMIDQYTGDISFLPNNDDVGVFEFTVQVTDAHNGMNSVPISLLINDINDPPHTPVISIPQEGRNFLEGSLVDLKGGGSDPDIDSQLNFRWFSSRDGPIADGPERKGIHLSTGRHIITLEASDGEFKRLTRINITVGEVQEEEGEEESYLLEWAFIIAGLGIFLLLFFGGVLLKNRPPFSKIFRVDTTPPHPSQPYSSPGSIAQSPLPTGMPQAKSTLTDLQSTTAQPAPAKPGRPVKTAGGLLIATTSPVKGTSSSPQQLTSPPVPQLTSGDKGKADTSDFMVDKADKAAKTERGSKPGGPAFGAGLDDIFDLPGKKGKEDVDEGEEEVACYKCGAVIPVKDSNRPLVIKCPECGTEGELT